MTLQFWSALQDSIIDSEFGDEDSTTKQASIKALDLELVLTLVRKARWPTVEEGFRSWAKGLSASISCYTSSYSLSSVIRSKGEIPKVRILVFFPSRSMINPHLPASVVTSVTPSSIRQQVREPDQNIMPITDSGVPTADTMCYGMTSLTQSFQPSLIYWRLEAFL